MSNICVAKTALRAPIANCNPLQVDEIATKSHSRSIWDADRRLRASRSMPGLALTTVWVPETTPQLLYCSAGSRSLDSPTAAVETTSAGCDAAMCYAARRETGGPSTRRWTFGPPQKNVTSDRGPRWRVCCYRDARVAIGMVAHCVEISSSVKSKSIRLIFGRIDCSRRVLEAQPKSLVQTVRLRAH